MLKKIIPFAFVFIGLAIAWSYNIIPHKIVGTMTIFIYILGAVLLILALFFGFKQEEEKAWWE